MYVGTIMLSLSLCQPPPQFAARLLFFFVGDAAMATYEITHSGGSIDFMNREPGANWLKRFSETYPKMVWLNPTPKEYWQHTHSTRIIQELMEDRMHPLTLKGMEEAMAYLSK